MGEVQREKIEGAIFFAIINNNNNNKNQGWNKLT